MPQIWQYNTYAEYYSISRALCGAKGRKMGQKLIQVLFISRSSSIYSYLVYCCLRTRRRLLQGNVFVVREISD